MTDIHPPHSIEWEYDTHPFWNTDILPGGLICHRTVIANVCMVADDADWVLVDAGVAGFGTGIVETAARHFGHVPPTAIVLTHGHFDHVGCLPYLLEQWPCPVYAHSLELPYLTGQSVYPPADPSVGGGLMSMVSPLYPRGPMDFGDRVQPLPEDGKVPGLPDWRWIHTPGHTEGHVSLFRQIDGSLLAGDAFITVKQESAMSVVTQRSEVHGPPAYFTQDWHLAAASVRRLAALRPRTAITGHGYPMSGGALRQGLERLAADFETLAIPRLSETLH